MPMLPTGLQRHRQCGTYYLRRRIPTAILPCYPGKKEVVLSLRTKDYRTALERHRLEEARLTAEWSKMRQRLTDAWVRQQVNSVIRIDALTPETIDAICQHAEAASLAGDETRRENGNYTPEEINDYQVGCAEANQLLKSAVAVGDYDVLRYPVEQFLQLYQYQLNVSEMEMRRLALSYARMAIRTNEKLLNRYEGKDEPTPTLARKLDTPMLSEVTQSYIEYYRKLDKPAMLNKVNAVMPLMLDIIGDKPIGSLKQTDLEKYFEAVQALPPRWKDVCRQENISARELAAQGRGEMSKGTFDGTYLAAMTPFIKYCRRKWQDHGWPMTLATEGVQYTGSRRDPEGGQRHFEPEELQRLFQGTEMAAFARDPKQAHCYWLPHLGLFTGARVNELCQLNPQIDIRQDTRSQVWYLRGIVGVREITKALPTTDRGQATPLALKYAACAKRMFLELRAGMATPNQDALKQVAQLAREKIKQSDLKEEKEQQEFAHANELRQVRPSAVPDAVPKNVGF